MGQSPQISDRRGGRGWRGTRACLQPGRQSPDYTLRIAPLRLELAPGKTINTFAYNGQQVSIDINNETDVDDIVHWHGLYLPSAADALISQPRCGWH